MAGARLVLELQRSLNSGLWSLVSGLCSLSRHLSSSRPLPVALLQVAGRSPQPTTSLPLLVFCPLL